MDYKLSKNWQSLSEIMGENYDSSAKYRIHNNVKHPSMLCLTDEENPTETTQGRHFPEFCEIYSPEGFNPKLRVLSKLKQHTEFYVDIAEVE